MRIWFDKYHPGYFGKCGMRTFHKDRENDYCPIVNIDKLWALAGEETYKLAKENKDKKAVIIDVVEKGFFKVTGKGKLPKIPIIVRAKFFTKNAQEKIKAAGGVCELRAYLVPNSARGKRWKRFRKRSKKTSQKSI
eukprot:EC824579.1.p1 GENE.EC824579.1~~EC824579.1.p1  ORF type:complete len:136 (+),score=56.62 EC824579.1:143-550(+)